MIKGPLLSPAACGPHRPGCCTQRNSAPYELGQRTSFWVAAGVVAHTLWTSAAPAMTYPLFAEEWHLTHTVTTGVFAIYPIVVAAVLVGFGDVSDYVGRRAAILWGVGASLFGTLLLALAPDVLWLFAGRAFMGIGVGLTAGPSTAAMVEFSGQGAVKRAATITTAAQAVGFAAALLLGGALIQYAPLPTRLNFWVLSSVLAALFAAAWFLPRRTGCEALWPLASQNPLHTEPFAQRFRGRDGGGNHCLHARRADPVARKSGCPRSRWIAQHARERRGSLAIRDRLGRGRDWREEAATSGRDDRWRRRIRTRHGAAGGGGRSSSFAGLPRRYGDLRRRI